MAAQLRYAIVGDSNVRRNFNKTNKRACPEMSTTQVLTCNDQSIFDECLSQVKDNVTVLLLSCITNFLTASAEDSMVGKRVEPVLESFIEDITGFKSRNPDVRVLVAPPMYRSTPSWYRDGLPEILIKFSSLFSDVSQVSLLPSFGTPEFEVDGVHLTAYSGLEYILHLFDSASSILSRSDEDDDDADGSRKDRRRADEVTRLLHDRVTSLEQDHKGLRKSVEYRAAVDAELHDYHENVRFEDFFIISGNLDRPQSGLGGREWQVQAIRTVQVFMIELIGHEASIDFIQNITGRAKDSITRYQVKVSTVSECFEIRSKFGKFFAGGDNRPGLFKTKEISIRNRVTQETRVRIAILQVLAKRYRDSNEGSKASVIGFESRPVLRITPPSKDVSDKRTKSYFFVEAVKKFPTNFSKKDLEHILSKVGSNHYGRLRSLFICLDDDLRRPEKSARPANGASEVACEVSEVAGDESRDRPDDSRRGSKRGPPQSGSSRTKVTRH